MSWTLGYAAIGLQRLADLGLKPDLVQEAPQGAAETAQAAEPEQTPQDGTEEPR